MLIVVREVIIKREVLVDEEDEVVAIRKKETLKGTLREVLAL